jgi:divinyl chlorophyllide a 8-vinyl-reductase
MSSRPQTPQRVLVFGASGTIGQATAEALVARGHEVVCFVRTQPDETAARFAGCETRYGYVTSPVSLARDAFCDEAFDVVISCLASRTGVPEDAWLIDYQANSDILKCAHSVGVGQMILLSAICVQKPRLAFQHAKLAFEKELADSGLTYSIVRPTAFFKSLSGQIDRVRRGKPFLLFGNGELTACKPISNADLANYIVDCIADQSKHNAVLPVGGPGPAITPKQQADMLFKLAGQNPRYRHVPVGLLDATVATLSVLGHISKTMAEKAEYARIGRYYATESMLVINQTAGRYDANHTPETGHDTLFDHYRSRVKGDVFSS